MTKKTKQTKQDKAPKEETPNQDVTVQSEVTTDNPAISNAPLTVLSQYVKDQSFENPHAPATFQGGKTAPEIQVNVNMEMNKIDEDQRIYEVTLRVASTATREGRTDFIAEITYAILTQIGEGVPEAQYHPLLLIEVPKLGFPFVRQILANMVQMGGYPPLLLNPVDFEGLYRQQYAQAQALEKQKA